MPEKGREQEPSLTVTQELVGYAIPKSKRRKKNPQEKMLHNRQGTFTQPSGQPSGKQGALALTEKWGRINTAHCADATG